MKDVTHDSHKFKFWFDERNRVKRQISDLKDPHSYDKLSELTSQRKAILSSSNVQLDDSTSQTPAVDVVERFASLGLDQVPYAKAKFNGQFSIEDLIGLQKRLRASGQPSSQ